jgi:hypothetical protein
MISSLLLQRNLVIELKKIWVNDLIIICIPKQTKVLKVEIQIFAHCYFNVTW